MEAIANNVESKSSGFVPNADETLVIDRVNLKSFLLEQEGRFVGLDFIKLDGTPRMLNGRLGVTSPLKGGVNTVEALSRPYLTVFDAQKRAYRTVSLDTVSALRALGRRYAVVN